MLSSFFCILQLPPTSALFPYTTLFRSAVGRRGRRRPRRALPPLPPRVRLPLQDHAALSPPPRGARAAHRVPRSEEHTSELQSRRDLVCRLLLEKKKSVPRRFWRLRAKR